MQFSLSRIGMLIPDSRLIILALSATMVVGLSIGACADDGAAAVTERGPTRQIDYFVRFGWEQRGVDPADRCTERTFARRVYLDLAGRVPTISELNNFLADDRDDKRPHLVDQLLESEDHVQHFADILDTLLMGRVAEHEYAERVKHQWRVYLEDGIRDNRPWNEVVAEILLARPETDKRGAVWFLYDRNNEHQAIAEAVAPAVFGIRVECAQCHDHMVASEIKQEHYWGLVAFFNRSTNKNTENGPRVAESAIGGFSEFANLSGDSSPNRLAFLAAETIDEPRPAKDEEQKDSDELYVPASVDGDPRVPTFSRRETFVEEVVNGHPLVSRAIVNRIWAMLLGRGIVHPHDEMDSVHQPSHPELLGWLAGDFSASGHDLRRLVRGIVLSEAYQLSSIRPEGVDDPASFAWYLERPLTAEQMARSIQLVVRGGCKNDDAIVGLMRQQFLEVLPDENVTTVRDALFLTNQPMLNDFITNSNEKAQLAAQLVALPTHADRARLLFESAMGRLPDDHESAAVVEYLEKREDSIQSAIGQVVWSLVTSAEFRFNH